MLIKRENSHKKCPFCGREMELCLHEWGWAGGYTAVVGCSLYDHSVQLFADADGEHEAIVNVKEKWDKTFGGQQ